MSGTTSQTASGPGGNSSTLSIVDLYWNGAQLDIKDGAKVKFGGVRNKPVKSTRKIFAAGEMMESEVSAEVIVTQGMSITGTFGTGTGELQVQADTGQIFVWVDAFVVGSVDLTAKADGSLSVKWNAGTPSEL